MELQAHGIVTDENDNYNGTIPDNVIPERIQAIVYNDTVYRQYLIDKRAKELRLCHIENPYRQNLERASRVREVDLILLFRTRIRSQNKASTSTIPTILSTTATSTPKYKKSKKGKGLFFRKPSGKCLSKTWKGFTEKSSKKSHEDIRVQMT